MTYCRCVTPLVVDGPLCEQCGVDVDAGELRGFLALVRSNKTEAGRASHDAAYGFPNDEQTTPKPRNNDVATYLGIIERMIDGSITPEQGFDEMESMFKAAHERDHKTAYDPDACAACKKWKRARHSFICDQCRREASCL